METPTGNQHRLPSGYQEPLDAISPGCSNAASHTWSQMRPPKLWLVKVEGHKQTASGKSHQSRWCVPRTASRRSVQSSTIARASSSFLLNHRMTVVSSTSRRLPRGSLSSCLGVIRAGFSSVVRRLQSLPCLPCRHHYHITDGSPLASASLVAGIIAHAVCPRIGFLSFAAAPAAAVAIALPIM